MPFELKRSNSPSVWFILTVYTSILLIVQFICVVLTPLEASWTWTNAIHTALSIIYIHWIKGSLDDTQGEKSYLTLWEQLEATQDTSSLREALLIVPTLLTYLACHFANYDPNMTILNVLLWCVVMLAKLPFMNGVRIFGINRTAGIDDEKKEL